MAGLVSPYEILPKLANLLAPTYADFCPFVTQPCRKGGFWRIPPRAAGLRGREKQERLPDNVRQALVRKILRPLIQHTRYRLTPLELHNRLRRKFLFPNPVPNAVFNTAIWMDLPIFVNGAGQKSSQSDMKLL